MHNQWKARGRLCGLIAFGGFAGSICSGQIIPANRVTTWQNNVGVLGGIPSRTTIFRTLTPTNSLADINAAIAACPSNQIVFLSAGTYFLNGQLIFNGVSGVTLRGAGSTNTTLRFLGSPPWGNILVQGPNVFGAIANNQVSGIANWTNGYAQGSTVLMLSTVSNLTVGTVICLDQLNDGNDVDSQGWEGLCTYCGRGSGSRAQEQVVKITAINGNAVSIWPPLYMPNWNASQAPQAWWVGAYSEQCGIENLEVDGSASAPYDPYGANIAFAGAWNCWVVNVKSDNARISHVNIYGGGRCEVRHCYFYGTQNAASLSYGILPIYTSADLVEDNIFNAVTAPVVLGSCASGCVCGYNYCTNDYYTIAPGWMIESFLAHDAHACMNLLEGNYAPGAGGDFAHGSSSYNTVFRNRLLGDEPGKNSDTYALTIWMKNRYWNVVGNILGTAGYHTFYDANVPGPWYESAIYEVGWADNYPGFTNDPVAVTTMYRHGNYDVVNNSIVWNSTNSDHIIPVSLYRTSRPSWFGNRPWPPFDPASPSAAAVTNLPAGYRFVFGVDPPAANTSTHPPVAVVSASAQNGPAPLSVNFSSAGSYDAPGVALSYYWIFGDGSVSTGANPAHTYQSPGQDRAQLTVSDGLNIAQSRILSVTVTNGTGH